MSKGEKVTLIIKSILSSLPTYFFSILPIPGKVANRMEKYIEILFGVVLVEILNYIWLNRLRFVYHYRWEGLGIRRLRSFNAALLGSWLWRHGLETDVLWKRVREAKYGNVWGVSCTKKVTSAYGVSLWRFIKSGWLNFSKLLRYDIGDGTKVKFWKHVWCGDCTLKEAFPELYYRSRAKDSLVAEVVLVWWEDLLEISISLFTPRLGGRLF